MSPSLFRGRFSEDVPNSILFRTLSCCSRSRFISQNWRGKPLISHEVIVNLIAATTTKSGLTVRSEVDQGIYPKGIKITDGELAEVRLKEHKFH